MDITIQKLNNTYSKILCEDGIRYELSDYLTFEVPNAKWSPQYKSGFWDGKIRLLKSDMTVYTGLVSEIEKFCSERNYTLSKIKFSGDELVNPDDLFCTIMGWEPKRFNEKLEKIPLKPYKEQLAAIYAALVKKRIIIESATAAGKSFIICSIIRYLQKKTLVIVDRVDLVNQLLDNFIEYFDDYDPDIDLLYSGQTLSGAEILISTRQSLEKKAKPFFKDFEVVIYDEVHTAESKTSCKIMEYCHNANYRIGLTGTLKDSKTHQLTLQGLFGKNVVFSRAKDNIREGKSANLQILVKNLKYAKPLDKFDSATEKYRAEMEYTWYSKERNKFVYNTCLGMDGISLILFRNTVHGELLYKEFSEKYPDKDAFLIHGGVNKDRRKEIKQYCLENPDKTIYLFASVGTFSTGINIPSIRNAILACSLKDKIKLLQSIGRGLRLKKDGGIFTFIDIIDHIPKGGTLKSHGNVRINKYIEQEFDYKIENIKITNN